MFESKTRFIDRLADAVDLVVDFATLGEYGFEPVAEPTPPCARRHRDRGSGPRLAVIDRAGRLPARS